MEAGAVADDGERGHSLPQGHGVEPHERGSRPGPRRRRPAQPLRPPRRVLQPLQPPPKEHRRRRRAARRPVQLVQRQAPASRRRCSHPIRTQPSHPREGTCSKINLLTQVKGWSWSLFITHVAAQRSVAEAVFVHLSHFLSFWRPILAQRPI